MTVDPENGKSNNRWNLLSSHIVSGNQTHVFNDFNKLHASLYVDFTVERHCEEYLHQIMIPGFVVMSLNVVLMFLSPESPERIVLYVISLFSHFLYLEQLRWM